MDTTWSLVTEHGLLSVTMTGIAQTAGIGRATLYKYFADVEAILSAWHERHVIDHLASLAEITNHPGTVRERLQELASSYAHICRMRAHHGVPDLSRLLHDQDHVAQAERQLHDLFRAQLAESIEAGDVRGDVPVDELAQYCVRALEAAGGLRSQAAVARLVSLTLDALGAPPRA